MRYRFNLEWDELPDNLKDEKVREYIEAGDPRDCENCDGTGKVTETIPAHQQAGEIADEQSREVNCETCGGSGEVEPDPEDEHQREEAEQDIRVHFPIYF